MSRITKTKLSLTLMPAIMTLAACSSGGSDPQGSDTGLISLGVSDAAVHDAEKVCITFESIEFKPAGEPSVTVDLDPPVKVNLLDFQGADAAPLLLQEELPAGVIDWVRLGVDARRGSNGGAGDTGGDACDGDASYIVMNVGTVYNLFVPSGEQTGLKLVGGFVVPSGGLINVTAEWDLMKGVTAPPGLSPDVILKPTIRLVDNLEVGILEGEIDATLATAVDCEPAVYLFNDGVVPNPISEMEDPDDPLATALVEERMNEDASTTYHYQIGFLPTGNYEVAFTCDGEIFEPELGTPAEILAQAVTVVDF